MDAALEKLVWARAQSCCEYCQLPQSLSEANFQIDHIVAEKHRGPTTEDNLALACYYCNSYKGPNIAGIDPMSGRLVRLFHPRKDLWSRPSSGTAQSSPAEPPSAGQPFKCYGSIIRLPWRCEIG